MRGTGLLFGVGLLTLTGPLIGQQPGASGPPTAPKTEVEARPAKDPTPVPALAYPRDRDRVVCRVDGKDYTFGDVVDHMVEYHAPAFAEFLATPAGALYFEHRLPAEWVRYFADVQALRAEARLQKKPVDAMNSAASEALKGAFQRLLDSYNRASWSESERLTLLEKFQRDQGLAIEVRGLLDLLVPEESPEPALYKFYQDYPRELSGVVTFSHIMIYHRDKYTLRALDEEATQAARQRIQSIAKKIKSDGANFADLAAKHSEDRRTADRGGRFPNVHRFDPRLPQAVVRAAWNLRDGQWTGPIESQYGLHLVRRERYDLLATILYNEAAHEKIGKFRRKFLQERLLYDVRKKRRVKLFY